MKEQEELEKEFIKDEAPPKPDESKLTKDQIINELGSEEDEDI